MLLWLLLVVSAEILAKRHFNGTRVVFFAGLDGTGHHMFRAAFLDYCSFDDEAEGAVRELWYSGRNFTQGYHALVSALRRPGDVMCLNIGDATSMLSYPNRNEPVYHPDVAALALAAEEARADLRIVVLVRDPRELVVSNAVHSKFMRILPETQLMYNQVAILYSQLKVIDRRYYMCAAYTRSVVDVIADVVRFVFPTTKNTSAILAHVRASIHAINAFNISYSDRDIRHAAHGSRLLPKFLAFDRVFYARFLPDLCPALAKPMAQIWRRGD